MTERISAADFRGASGVEDWRVIWSGGYVGAHFRTRSFRDGATLVQVISDLADSLDHHPDLDVRSNGVAVRLFTHSIPGLSQRDVTLAQQISLAAREIGAIAEPALVQHVQIAIDTLAVDAVRPFWRAVLGYEEAGDANLLDPLRRGPSLWFQQTDERRTQRGRIHVDVYLPHDHVARRIDAALAAGGHMVSDVNAPEWWTLGDAEGNEVDLATWG